MRDRRALTRVALVAAVVASVVVVVRRRRGRGAGVPADLLTAVDEGVAAANGSTPQPAEWIPVGEFELDAEPDVEVADTPAGDVGLVAPA